MPDRYDEQGRRIIASASDDGFVTIDFSKIKDGWVNTNIPEDVVVDWDADLARLPEQDEVPAIVDLRREKRIIELIEYKDDSVEAERRIRERDLPPFVPREFLRGDEFLAQPDDPTAYLVDQLWPYDGNVLFAAPAKFGKSTMIMNLVRSLLTGEAFLGFFQTNRIPKNETILLVDLEMNASRVRRELRGQGIPAQAAHQLIVADLRGDLKNFAFTDPEVRQHLIKFCRDNNVKTLIIDPLAPLFGYMDVEENDNTTVNKFFTQLDAFKRDAGIRDMLCAHHCGHSADWRPRGASRFNDWPDSLWLARINGQVNDPNSPRELFARGRDIWESLQGEGTVKRDPNNDKILLFETQTNGGISVATQVIQEINSYLTMITAPMIKQKDLILHVQSQVSPPPADSVITAHILDMAANGTLHRCKWTTVAGQPWACGLPGNCPDCP